MRPPQTPREPLTPRPGRWLWTCRAGFEAHLFEELAWARANPRLIGEALVESDAVKREPAFARMGFAVSRLIRAEPEAIARELERIREQAAIHVQAWAPDADRYQPLHALATALGDEVVRHLTRDLPTVPQLAEPPLLATAELALQRGGQLAQLCLIAPDTCVVGTIRASDALSLGPGGRRRMWRESDISRAAMKLEEALDRFGFAPGKGERCADLGAAPGGWTQRLLARNARVIAVDPARLSPELMRHPKLSHVQDSAFAFAPDEPLDWLFCDMAWRPLEVAQLLAKWARRGWADYLIANLKLPMKDKNPILFRARATLEEAGWKELRIRQLYHDRDEVTVLGRRR